MPRTALQMREKIDPTKEIEAVIGQVIVETTAVHAVINILQKGVDYVGFFILVPINFLFKL